MSTLLSGVKLWIVPSTYDLNVAPCSSIFISVWSHPIARVSLHEHSIRYKWYITLCNVSSIIYHMQHSKRYQSSANKSLHCCNRCQRASRPTVNQTCYICTRCCYVYYVVLLMKSKFSSVIISPFPFYFIWNRSKSHGKYLVTTRVSQHRAYKQRN